MWGRLLPPMAKTGKAHALLTVAVKDPTQVQEPGSGHLCACQALLCTAKPETPGL